LTDVSAHEDRHPAAAQSAASDALVWPPPVDDLDILWLDEAASRPVGDTAAPPAILDDAAPHPIAVAALPDRSVAMSRLRSAGVTVEWHDAVALVQQLVDQLAPDRSRPPAGSIPPLDAIRIEPSGRLQVTLNPPGEPFVKGLGKLLNELLQSNPAPANLRLLAWQAASDSAAPLRLEEFGRQLAGWERPGRPTALVALHARAASAPSEIAGPALPAEPLPMSPPGIRAADPPAAPSPDPSAHALAAARRKRIIASVSAAACVTLLAAGAGVYSMSQNAAAPVVSSESVGSDIELPRMSARLRRLQSSAAISRTSRSTSPQRLNHAGPGSPAVEPRDARAGTRLERPRTAPLELFAAEAAPVVSRQPSIFTNDDATIVEPELIRPYLPLRAHPGTPPDALGVLELVIDTRGLVESVHLTSPDNRYRERWWVFSAKNWQFRPAMQNGKPVRFLKRIPLTDLNMMEPQ
jgi:hypothetical protein